MVGGDSRGNLADSHLAAAQVTDLQRPRARPSPIILGWRELLSLPELGVNCIRAKIDSGARSSSLHVHDQELFNRDGKLLVRFVIEHGPRGELRHEAEAEVIAQRDVTDSGGHRNRRLFIPDVTQSPGALP